MTKQRVIIRPEAQQDLREAALWYETPRPGLGERFATKIEGLIERIADKASPIP
ncbi:MAG TPA: type II toxin-antitoxin system RelE/ParE family toxin [Blastocatellia bacterium]|nr:type II toxin-antitoxin system RelE/ParE family toxin [Blastocatellia bacterium]